MQAAVSAAKDVYIALSNQGESRWKHRKSASYKKRKGAPSARDRLEQIRSERKVLTKVTKRSAKLKVPYRLMTEDRYKKVHKGKTPEQDGVKVKEFSVHGKLRRMCMIRQLDADEFDYVDEEEEGVQIEEELNNSEGALRLGQLESEFAHYGTMIDAVAADAADMSKLFDSGDEAAAGGAEGVTGKDESSGDSDESDADSESPERPTVGFLKVASRPSPAKSQAKPLAAKSVPGKKVSAPTAITPTKGRSVSSATGSGPAVPSIAVTRALEKRAKDDLSNRGNDADVVIQRHTKKDNEWLGALKSTMDSLKEMWVRLVNDQTMQSICISTENMAAASRHMQKLQTDTSNLSKAIVSVLVNLRRKFAATAEIMDDCDNVQKLLATMTGIAVRYMAVKPDANQFDIHCQDLDTHAFELPVAIKARRTTLLALELVRFQQYSEFADKVAGTHPDDPLALPTKHVDYPEFRFDVVEKAVMRLVPAGGRYLLTDLEVHKRVANFATEVLQKQLVTGEAEDDFLVLQAAVVGADEDVITEDMVKLADVSMRKLQNLPEQSILSSLVKGASWAKLEQFLSKSREKAHSSRSKRNAFADVALQVGSAVADNELRTPWLKDIIGKMVACKPYIVDLEASDVDYQRYRTLLAQMTTWGYEKVKGVDGILCKFFEFTLRSKVVIPATIQMTASSLMREIGKIHTSPNPFIPRNSRPTLTLLFQLTQPAKQQTSVNCPAGKNDLHSFALL